MPPDRPLSDVLQDILGSLQEMIRAEVRLAKAELTDDAKHVAISSLWVVGGVVCGWPHCRSASGAPPTGWAM